MGPLNITVGEAVTPEGRKMLSVEVAQGAVRAQYLLDPEHAQRFRDLLTSVLARINSGIILASPR